MIDLWLPETLPTSAMRRCIVLGLCTGDWSVRGTITHHLPSGFCGTVEQARSMFLNEFVDIIVGSGPPGYPAKSWIRSELAMSWCGLLESLHGLLTIVYCLWVGKPLGEVHRDVVPDALIAVEDLHAAVEGEAPEPDGEALAPDLHADAGGNAGTDADVDPVAQYRRDMARFKFVAWNWLRSGAGVALSDLIEMRRIVEPHRKCLADLLFMSGEEWDDRQKAAMLNTKAEDGVGRRDYRLTVAHSCKLECRLYESCATLLHAPGLWQLVPRHCWTEARRSSFLPGLHKVSALLMMLH